MSLLTWSLMLIVDLVLLPRVIYQGKYVHSKMNRRAGYLMPIDDLEGFETCPKCGTRDECYHWHACVLAKGREVLREVDTLLADTTSDIESLRLRRRHWPSFDWYICNTGSPVGRDRHSNGTCGYPGRC